MIAQLKASEQIQIFFKYINKPVWIRYENGGNQFGTLTGVKLNALQITVNGTARWFPLYDDFRPYTIKLLLKPLSRLTPEIIARANNLPIKNFIVQYYDKLGFDMPIFLAPGHPDNCKNVYEIGLADYRSAKQIKADCDVFAAY